MKTNGQLLQDALDEALAEGEMPYQANRSALKALDLMRDLEGGKAHLEAVLSGIDSFAASLERFRDAAENVSRRAVSAVR